MALSKDKNSHDLHENYVLIDFKKAFDSVDRMKWVQVLIKRAQNNGSDDMEKARNLWLVRMILDLYTDHKISIFGEIFEDHNTGVL